VVLLQGANGPFQVQVSRIVACNFLREPRDGEVVNHLNGNKLDNRAKNLEWTSQKKNICHSNDYGLRTRLSKRMSGLGLEEKKEIRETLIKARL
jgi:hypothetical protein